MYTLSTQNRLKESLNLYEEIWNNRYGMNKINVQSLYLFCERCLRNVSVILFLNKMDVLKEKIGKKIHLDNFYPDFLTYLPPSGYNTAHYREFSIMYFLQMK